MSTGEMDRRSLEDWARHLGEVRKMVEALSAEERERGRRFSSQWSAVSDARRVLSGDQRITDRRRESVLEHLEQVQHEIETEFAAWREERGIPAI